MTERADKVMWQIIRWCCLAASIACMIFIFANSAETGNESGEKSETLAERVAPIVVPHYEELTPPEQKERVVKVDFHLRNAAHFSEFAALGFFLYPFFLSWNPPSVSKVWRWRRTGLSAIFAVALSAGYALSDEIHQFYVPGRAFEWADVATDARGALLGVVISALCTTAVLIVWRAVREGK